jgi:predicted amidohydrolase
MNQNLHISLIQTDLVWENPQANIKNFEEKINNIPGNPDLVILPEMFNSGFSMHFSETHPSESLAWLSKFSSAKQTSIFGSLAIAENGKNYNRGYFVKPNGEQYFYDKKHLFKYGKEHETYTAGTEILTIEYKNWKIRPLICYDLRFPVWSRNTAPFYDLLIYVASWPLARIEAWRTLLRARAIENQCYVVGVNRIGIDGNHLIYNGQSLVIDYTGEVLCDAEENDTILSVELSFENLQNFRTRFPFLSDGDSFELR